MEISMITNWFLYLPLLLILYLITKHFFHKVQNLPPTPFISIPILGHLHLLKPPIHRTLARLSRTYGPTLYLSFGSRPALVVSSPSAAEQCLHQNDVVFANRPCFIGGQIMFYNNTILVWAPYGDHWRNLRRISTVELLSAHRLQLLSAVRQDEVGSLIQRLYLKSKSSQQPLDGDAEVEMRSELLQLTYDVIMKMIAGKWCCRVDNKGERFQKVLEEMLEVAKSTNMGDFLPFLRKMGFRGLEKTFHSIHQKSDKLLQEMVEELRSNMGDYQEDDEDSSANTNRKNKPIIQVLLELQKVQPEYYTDEIIKGLILNLLLAGIDTSAITIEWALSLLLNNPSALEKARFEIDTKVGFDCLISESDLTHLSFLQCIIKETLRMYPPVPLMVPHESSKECAVGGYRVQRGTMLFVNVWAIQNDQKVWEEPRQFRPERFEGVEGNRIGYKSMPFGSGRRGCPGETLAMKMVGLTLGALIQCFEWPRIGEKLVDMEEGAGITMPKAKPLIAKISPRHEAFRMLSQM